MSSDPYAGTHAGTTNLHSIAQLAAIAPADDHSQEVFLAALHTLPAPHASLAQWFQGARHKRALQTARSEGARRTREHRAARSEPTWDGRGALEEAEVARVVTAGLQALTAEERAILEAHYWEGMTLAAIAARTGRSHGAIKRRHAHALAELRLQLGDPSIDRRDWALGVWALGVWSSGAAAAACLLVGGFLGLHTGAAFDSAPAQVETTTVAALTLSPAKRVRAPVAMRRLSLPAVKLIPAMPLDARVLAATGSALTDSGFRLGV